MDKGEFDSRVRGMTDRLYRVGCGMLPNREDREDAAQEAILKAWKALPRLLHPEYFETWLTRIYINEAKRMLKARRRTVAIDAVPEEGREDGSELRDAIAALDEALRVPVILVYASGYTVREAARILHLTEGGVKSRLYRARKMLRSMLEGQEEDHE